jgi:UDP-3-O-[3-hydroxymyristoyl] N-acetylglucosamine deacetylase
MMLEGPSVVLEGIGLHGGEPARVVLRRCDGPVRLRANGEEANVGELVVAGTARATTVEGRSGGRLRVGTVEHAFAALAGMGVYAGVLLEVDGGEMPLLDGAAAAWCEALERLGAPVGVPRLRVVRSAVLRAGPSTYEFSPGAGVDIEVRLELDDPRIHPTARWAGDAADFRSRIAPARTFATSGDMDELARRGLARHVPPASVILVTPGAILCAGRPFVADEPARHKLLDLLGDLYLHGGPPIGCVRAVRPGHAANARVLGRAREEGILAPG